MKIFLVSPSVDILFKKEQLAQLEKLGDLHVVKTIKPLLEVEELFDGTEDRILAIDPDFVEWKLSNDVLAKMPNLKAIVLQTTSFDWLDVKYCAEKKIPVVNLRGFSSEAVAEWALWLALTTARNVPVIAKGNWEQNYSFPGVELKGKKAGVIGIGRIGSRIAELSKGVGMNVSYWSRRKSSDMYGWVELENLMSDSDIIFLALPLSPETKGIIPAEMINKMKKTAIFVSVVNHGIYDHDLLIKSAEAGKIYGYAFEEEGGKTFTKYKGNVCAVPALGWCTTDSMSKNVEQWIEAITLAIKGQFPNKVS